MITLNTNKSKPIRFDVQVEGAQANDLHGKFCLKINDVIYAVPVQITDRAISTVIPPISKMVKEHVAHNEKIECFLEVYANDFYNIPWKGKAEVHRNIAVEATFIDDEDAKEVVIKESTDDKRIRIVSEDVETEPVKDDDFDPTKTKVDNGFEINIPKTDKKIIADSDSNLDDKLEPSGDGYDTIEAKYDKLKELVDKRDQENEPRKNRGEYPSGMGSCSCGSSGDGGSVSEEVTIEDIYNFLSERGIKNSIVQTTIIQTAKAKAGNDAEYSNVLTEVKRYLKKGK